MPGNVKKIGILLGGVFLFAFQTLGQTVSKSYTSAGTSTFTVPSGVTNITVECWGAGGGGGSRSNNGCGGGGGGGAYARSNISVTAGTSYTIVVGTGGGANTAGGNSSFNTSIVVAAGGRGGTNNSTTGGSGGTIAASTGTIEYAGGNGASGGSTYSGGGGGGAGSTGAGGNAPTAALNSYGTGTTVGGGNGGASVSGNVNGNVGNSSGGGGSGAARTSGTRNGGSGANGQVKITWVCPSASILYSGTPFCVSTSTLQNVTLSGSSGGTFSSTPSGLTINSTTGAITPSTSAVGIYTVYYQIPADVDGLCSGVNATTTVTISPLLTPSVNITVAPGNSICVGTTVSFTATPTNGGSSPSYQWKRNGSNVGTNSPNYSNSSLSNGDQISCTLTSNASCVSSSTANSNVITMSVGSAVTANAGGAMSPICIGGTSATLGGSVNGATGGIWTASVTGGIFSPSATDLNATWKPSASFTGTATLTLTTTGGTCTATASKTILVVGNPTVSCDKTVLNICQGSTTSALDGTFGGGASGAVWSDGGIGGTFANNSGSTPSTTTWTPLASYSGTAVLTLTSTGSACTSVSETRNIVVTQVPVILTQPSNVLDCEDRKVDFEVTVSGTVTSYVWQRMKPSESFIDIPLGEIGISYSNGGSKLSVDNVGGNNNPHGSKYWVIVSNGTCSVTSASATLSVNEITTLTGATDVTLCYGSSYSYTVTTTYIPKTYQWKKSVEGGPFTNVSNGGAYSGANSNQLIITNGSPSESAEYRVYMTFDANPGADCNIDSHDRTRKITFLPQLQAGTISATQTICYNASAQLIANPAAGGSGSTYTYQWQSSDSNSTWNSIGGATALTYQTPALTSPTYYRIVATDGETYHCGTATSESVTITLNPLPAVTSSSTGTICSGSVTGISLTASIASNFSWTVGPITGGITGASGGSGSTINQTLINPGNATAGTVKYIVTPTSVSGGCAGAPFTITVTVNPLPVVTNSPAVSICNGNNTNIALTASVPSSFTWTIGTISGNITGATAGSGATISQTLINTDVVAGTVQYIVVPTSTPEGCTGSPFTITVTVNPLPTITLGTLPSFCAGATNFLIPYLSTSQAPTTFSISVGTPALAGFTPIVNAPLSSSPLTVPLPAAVPPGTYQFIITVRNANGCVSLPKTIDVILQDVVPPVINCPANVVASADATHCYATTVALGTPVATDNCSTVSVTNNVSGTFPVGVTTVTWTATDVAGNKASCTQLVTVIDQTPPTAICKNITVSLNSSGTATITAASVDNGSNDACGIKSLSVNKASFDCTNIGANTVVLTVTDNSNNVSSCSAIVTVVDPIPPVARCKPYSVELNAFGNATIAAANIDNGSSDNCSFTLSVSKSTFDCTNVGPNSVTLSVTDAGGNVSTCTAVVTVYDHIAPVARCKDFVLNLQAGGTATLTANDIDNGSTDNCSNLTKTLSKTTFNCSNVGTNTVTLTVTDAGGNSSSCTATVIVKDLTPPTAVCKNITAYLDNTGKSVITPSMVDNGSSDNCGGSIMLSLSKTTFDCTNRGTNTVILTVTDASGNSATCTSIVTIVDNIAPIATCKDYTLTVNAATGTGTLSAPNLNGGSTDNCSIASYQISKDNVTYGSTLTYTCSDVGVKTVYFKVTDVAGNSSTCTSQVTIKSSLEITNISLDLCGFVFSQTVTGGSGDYSYFWDGRSTGQKPFGFFLWPTNTSTSSDPSLNIFLPNGTYTIYLTVTDNASGCSLTKPYTFVIDGSLGGTTTISSQACAGQTLTYSTIATGSSYSWAVTNGTVISGGGSGDRTITVTWSSSASTGQIVTTINLLGNLCKTVETNNVTINPLPTPAFSSYTATLCPGSTQTYTLTSSFASHAWTITGGALVSGGDANQNYVVVKWGSGSTGTVSATVTNSSGCSATATPVSVSLVDNQKPVITSCPSSKTVSANFGLCYATGVELGTLAATDACTSQSELNITNNAPAQFPIGNTTVTWTVSDLKGNTSTCTQIITVVDNQYPTITCQSNVTLNANTSCTATYDPVLPTYSDNCGTPTLAWKITQGTSVTNGTGDIPLTSFNPGVTVVAYTVTDATGKSASCQFNITVTDNTPPTIVNCPSTVTVTTNNGCTATGVNLGTLTATDNCTSQASLTITNNAPASYPLGKTLVTWTVTDATGLSATCTQEVNVTDNIAPTISCPSNISATTAVGSCTRSVFTPDPTTSDNCSVTKLTWSMTGATVSSSASSGINKVGTKTFSLGVTTITYVVTDASNNSATCSFTVTVTDNQAPTLSACPSPSSSYMSSLGLNYAILSFTAPTATENCSSATLTWTASGATPSSGTGNISNAHFPVGNTVVTYQAVDASGNISTCQFTVIVNPNFPPDITCTSTTRSTDAGICTATFNPGNPTLISGDEPVSYLWTMAGATTGSGTGSIGNQTFNKGATTISWIASNVAGNDYCTQTITITDTEAPVVSCSSIPASVCVNGASQYTHSGTGWNATATDNCGSVSSLTYQLSGATAGNGTSLNGASFNVGNTTVVWTATDNSGNSSSCTYTVTVNSPPSCSITGTGGPVCPSSNNTFSGPSGMATYSWSISSGSALIGGAANQQAVSVTSGSGCNTSYVLSLTITDSNGCSSTCTKTVTVQDVTAPVITCPTVSTPVSVTSGSTYIHSGTSWDATATDTCSGTITYSASLTGSTTNTSVSTLNGVAFNIGTTHVVWRATDGCSNSGTCTFDVVVLAGSDLKLTKTGPATASVGSTVTYTLTVENLGPTDAPVVTISDALPASFSNQQFSTNGGSSWTSWTGSYQLPTALANGASQSILVRGTPVCSALGTVTNTASVALLPYTDLNLTNNTSTVVTTVADTTSPTYTAPTLAAGYCVENIYQAVYKDVPEGDPYDLTYLRPDYYLFGAGFIILDLTNVADNCALANPAISWTIDFGNNGSVDLSGNGQISVYGGAIQFPKGDNKVTYTVKDASGNTTEKSVILKVIPRPTITKNF